MKTCFYSLMKLTILHATFYIATGVAPVKLDITGARHCLFTTFNHSPIRIAVLIRPKVLSRVHILQHHYSDV